MVRLRRLCKIIAVFSRHRLDSLIDLEGLPPSLRLPLKIAPWVISTDVLLERITPHIGVHPFYGGDPLSEYLESLGRLGGLAVERILPSHGDPFGGHAERIEAVQRHHARRLDKIHGVVDGNELHAYAVAGVVWGEDRSLIDRRFAMAEALSHLEHLRRSGRVERSQPDGVDYWSAKS